MNVNALDHDKSIRSATEKDLDQVMEVERLSFSAPWTENFFKSGLKEVFLVFEKKEIVGFLNACVCADLEKAVILKLAVHPDHRREGIGEKLIRRCLDILIERQISIVELDVELIQRGAIKLYEKLGFKIANILVFPSNTPGDEETFYVMRLALPKSGEAVSSER